MKMPTLFSALLCLALSLPAVAAQPLKTRHVVLIVADGLRWQEIFTGAERDLLTTDHGGNWETEDYLLKNFWRDSPEERRKAVFPFLWGTIAAHGQIIGNQAKGSIARVTNGVAFSYPGYNEMLTGVPDPKIDSNEFGPNPNITVYEWLNGKPQFHDRVGAFATWDIFNDIFNQPRGKLGVFHVGGAPAYPGPNPTPRQLLMNQLVRDTTKLDSTSIADAFLQPPLLDFLATGRPLKLLFVGFGETDDWAHAGRYDLVLEAARSYDRYVEQIWNALQARPEYRDTTTIILTADHGRGSGPVDWKEHGVDQKGSENIWLAAMGPDTAPLGERSDIETITQSQIPATLAALLGEDYRGAVPAAGAPIAEVLPAGWKPD